MMARTVDAARAAAGLLRPCPFCGGEAALEADALLEDGFRIACGNAACGVRPRTEPLLACYADELCAAWNGRAPVPTELLVWEEPS